MTTTAGVEFCYFLAEKDNVQTFKIHVGTRRSKGMDGKGDGRAFSPTSRRCHVSRVQSPETHQESLRFCDAVTGISEDQVVVFTKRKNDKLQKAFVQRKHKKGKSDKGSMATLGT
ncbi:hypothetical protein NC652_024528 [Populus alba x Populus x berolinensis]|uniref:Uncharacterized protein n=2 Tax=Populus TaxID=3689 RepID=A0ACC4BGI4_POPAL|nr:hypothetical protein NC652_024528 [Populus alba x Populus x berolinensis]KAJ6980758.1 hypothetical protein NC653_024190 [Populus alba x Populus x berolinensis]